jgi:hypothetical protein
MSGETACYENYPWWVIVPSSLLTLAIYGLGAYTVYQWGWIWMTAYLLFVLVLEVRLLKSSCVHCYYYGKTCAFGRGRLSGPLFKRGDPKTFSSRNVTWRELIPDILVSLIPVVAGIVFLIRDFAWPVLAAVILLLFLSTVGNGFVRSNLACRHCRQRELGCPAERLFQKAESQAG